LKKLYRQATSMAEFHLKRRDHYGRVVYKELVNRLHQYVSTVDMEIFRIVVDDCSEYRRYLLKPFVK
jgi:KaiC/GvpD/RAD55 family RecA-like ATPase